jgi:hypothetical protein
MLYTVAVILWVLWLLCLVSGYAIGAFIVPTANSGQCPRGESAQVSDRADRLIARLIHPLFPQPAVLNSTPGMAQALHDPKGGLSRGTRTTTTDSISPDACCEAPSKKLDQVGRDCGRRGYAGRRRGTVADPFGKRDWL